MLAGHRRARPPKATPEAALAAMWRCLEVARSAFIRRQNPLRPAGVKNARRHNELPRRWMAPKGDNSVRQPLFLPVAQTTRRPGFYTELALNCSITAWRACRERSGLATVSM